MTLKQYLENKNASSSFLVEQSDIGGNITFSNSGKRGSVKQFTLGLDSFIAILKDIKTNIIEFQQHEKYFEKEWRDLGNKYFSDGPANAMSTVQTKPLFTTISKIIAWANSPNLENIDTDQFLKINQDILQNAIDKLEELSSLYKIHPNEELKIEIPKEAQIIYSYLVKSFSHRKIQKDILGIPAPANGGGFQAMNILHDFDINDSKKGVLASISIEEEINKSTGKYLDALMLIKKYYPELTKKEMDGFFDITKYVNLFRDATFESIKLNYSKIYDQNIKLDIEWRCNIEDKLQFIKDENNRNAIMKVIRDLKDPSYSFSEIDRNNLSTFSRVIDKTINASNFINNFTEANLKRDGLTLDDFFNQMKESASLSLLISKINLTGTLSSIIPFYFSAVKNCQSPEDFPIYYKYWYTLLDKILDKGKDYDNLTEFYRTLPLGNRLRNFFAFFGTLGKVVLIEIKRDLFITSKESKIYKKISSLITMTHYIDEVFELNNKQSMPKKDFIHKDFFDAGLSANYYINEKLSVRFISSLLTKPFVILTGLSGSGKTKLAQAFAMWICENENQYCIVPVGADWTNREPLLGYPNALENGKYVSPENGVLALILEAMENEDKPYFLILDEMNLSHVERYFADFLSVMESSEVISLHQEAADWKDVIPAKIKLPKNLFIVGTVNIDETTYMFSPKVLDRANVIEFRISETEMEQFLDDIKPLDLDSINGFGANMAASFVELAKNKELKPIYTEDLNKTLNNFFNELKKTGAEFGYRSAAEIHRFVAVANHLDSDWKIDGIIDCAIMQKLLPKVHGSRRKLEPVLKTLGSLCLAEGKTIEEIFNRKTDVDFNDPTIAKYPLSLEKIDRMYKGLTDNGFTSYAEA